MRSLLGFIIRLAIFLTLAVWLADRPGTARIVWHDYVIETSAAFLGLCALASGFVFYLIFRFWHLLRHGPERWRMHRRLQKMRRGQEQLTEGLIAVAGGNAAEAGRLAVGARKLLGPTAATQLLQAQAAQLAGDRKAAKAIFQNLASNPSTAILGYRGLIMEARRDQDWAEVGALVEKLRETKPNTPWLHLIRFELLARKQEWSEAGLALTQASAAHLMEPAQTKEARAALLTAASQDAAKSGDEDKALQSAEQAVKQANHWLPAIINLAQRQMGSGHTRAAQRTVEKYWGRMPHIQLANAYCTANLDALAAYRQLERLCHANENAAVSHLALAQAALDADIWGEARRHLIALVSHGDATQGVYRMLARLERRESGDEQAALQWMTKAADAPADPVWLCDACGGPHENWQATCHHCGSFNTLEWQSPGVSRMRAKAQALIAHTWID
ncbi:MAG TPA: heme biosynthesis HemY N-terminal domain-containing protein [Alphaproteobacteria bacterium]|nr:heme biosynthesis HemY N-terminal domain-containing protein [Alphaproteobacteria bacterium]